MKDGRRRDNDKKQIVQLISVKQREEKEKKIPYNSKLFASVKFEGSHGLNTIYIHYILHYI